MKKRLMIFCVVAVAFSGGCRHMPSWMLQGHVDAYNALHEGEQIEANNGQETRHGTD